MILLEDFYNTINDPALKAVQPNKYECELCGDILIYNTENYHVVLRADKDGKGSILYCLAVMIRYKGDNHLIFRYDVKDKLLTLDTHFKACSNSFYMFCAPEFRNARSELGALEFAIRTLAEKHFHQTHINKS